MVIINGDKCEIFASLSRKEQKMLALRATLDEIVQFVIMLAFQ